MIKLEPEQKLRIARILTVSSLVLLLLLIMMALAGCGDSLHKYDPKDLSSFYKVPDNIGPCNIAKIRTSEPDPDLYIAKCGPTVTVNQFGPKSSKVITIMVNGVEYEAKEKEVSK